jgi:hypothetical protein
MHIIQLQMGSNSYPSKGIVISLITYRRNAVSFGRRKMTKNAHMKRIKELLLLVACILSFDVGFGQTVTIPDNNFKTALLLSSDTYPNRIARNLNGDFIAVDANSDGEIQVSEAEDISYLYIPNLGINSMEGIEAFVNLDYLVCGNNNFSSLNISTLTELEEIQCSHTNLTEIDFSSNLKLETILMESNQLTTVDVSHLHSLNFVSFNHNELVSLFFKTGSEPHVVFVDNPIQYVCVDDSRVAHYQQYLENFLNCTECTVNSYCSFTPGGDFYTVEGDVKIDLDSNGCDTNDPIYPNLKLSIDNGTVQDFVVNDNSGSYNIPLQEGTYEITPVLEGIDYFQASPATLNIEFPTSGSPFMQDFCIVPIGTKNDLEISIIPLTEARPGFEADYKLLYKNKGNTMLSGSANLSFDSNYMTLSTAIPAANSQTTGSLTWNYTDLLPFESGEILFTMTLNTPTDANFPLNGGDFLNFEATVNPLDNDETPEDNVMVFDQEVVNSFDPNDITCLEGSRITDEDVGTYLHYLIRFENTGSASAINVVIKDVLDQSKFDVSSLIPLDASHTFYVRKQNENVVEFVFENIQLPFDDANNDGFVLFKIKTLETLEVGDFISNKADIFFDFNLPITTNTAFTEVTENTLSTDSVDLVNFSVYPNPASNELKISWDRTEKVSVQLFNVLGQLVYHNRETSLVEPLNIDTSQQATGVYFLKINTATGSTTQRIVIN